MINYENMEEVKKEVTTVILEFWDYCDKKHYTPIKLAYLFGVTDDTIRYWKKGMHINSKWVNNFTDRIKEKLKSLKKPDSYFIQYLLEESSISFNSLCISKIKSSSSIERVMEYLYGENGYGFDMTQQNNIALSEDDLKKVYSILKVKITHNIEKNRFYSFRQVRQDGVVDFTQFFIQFAFPDGNYNVRVFLTDSSLPLNTLSNPDIPDVSSIRGFANSFTFAFRDNTNAFIIFTGNYYPQEIKSYLLSMNSPIYIKEISFRKLKKQITSIYDLDSEQPIENVLYLNQLVDYILHSIQCDFDLILKNYLASYGKLELNCSNVKRNFTFSSYDQEIDFESFLLKREIVDLLTMMPKEERCLKIVVFNYKSVEPLVKALMELSNLITHNYREKIIELIICDGSCDVVSLLKQCVYPKFITVTTFCLKAEILDLFTDKFSLHNSVDLFFMGVGSLSMLKNPQKYFTYINLWLKNNGKVFVSAHNKQGKALNTYKSLLRQNLKMITERTGDIAEYFLSSDNLFRVFCHAYEKREIIHEVTNYFSLEAESDHTGRNTQLKVYMHPSLSPLIDKDIPKDFKDALCQMERQYSTSFSGRSKVGYFTILVARKRINKRSLPDLPKCDKIIDHAIAVNRGWQLKQINHTMRNPEPQMFLPHMILKVILLRAGNDKALSRVYCILTESGRTIQEKTNKNKVRITGCSKFIDSEPQLLTVAEINRLGFEIGNLSPFSQYYMADNGTCQYYYDSRIEQSPAQYLVVGSGLPNRSCLFEKKALLTKLRKMGYQKEFIATQPYDING